MGDGWGERGDGVMMTGAAYDEKQHSTTNAMAAKMRHGRPRLPTKKLRPQPRTIDPSESYMRTDATASPQPRRGR